LGFICDQQCMLVGVLLVCSRADAWDGTNLRFTFRRTVSLALFSRWLELVYGVVNNGDVVLVHTPAVCKLHISPRNSNFHVAAFK
jgi:hypothetical protein